MKKYIRSILDDVKKLAAKPVPPPAQDLNAQELSKDPKERTRQLEFQDQKREERTRLS
jgi:hypothetical protein